MYRVGDFGEARSHPTCKSLSRATSPPKHMHMLWPESESERALIPRVFTHTSNSNDRGVFEAAGIFTLHNILFF